LPSVQLVDEWGLVSLELASWEPVDEELASLLDGLGSAVCLPFPLRIGDRPHSRVEDFRVFEEHHLVQQEVHHPKGESLGAWIELGCEPELEQHPLQAQHHLLEVGWQEVESSGRWGQESKQVAGLVDLGQTSGELAKEFEEYVKEFGEWVGLALLGWNY